MSAATEPTRFEWSGVEGERIELLPHDATAGFVRLATDPERRDRCRALLGPYCHQSRNLLNSLRMGMYLAERDSDLSSSDAWQALQPRYAAVERLYERLQLVFRPLTLATVNLPLDLLLEDGRADWTETLNARGRPLEFHPPRERAVGPFDPARLRLALDAFVAWRAEAGAPGVPLVVRWNGEQGRLTLDLEEPEARMAAGALDDPEFALPLLARIIAAHQGTMRIQLGAGLRVGLTWPLLQQQEAPSQRGTSC